MKRTSRFRGEVGHRSRRATHWSTLLLSLWIFPASEGIGAEITYNRWLPAEGVANFRDIGGYDAGATQTVATGVVFRTGTLAFATTNDVTLIHNLGVRTIIDFRTTDNIAIYPDAVLLDEFTTHVFIPTTFPGASMLEAYGNFPTSRTWVWQQAFETVAFPENLPLIYHCWAGKDRTGVMTALLLTLLGVDRQTVIDDYMLSNYVYTGYVYRDWIEATLATVDREGGIEAYMDSIGVDSSERAAIRSSLLMPKAAAVRSRWHLYR
jgi:protein-tyrosine phosphatase